MTVENRRGGEISRPGGVIATEIDTGSAARGRARLYFLIKAEAVLCIRDKMIIIYFLLVIAHRCYLALRVPLTSTMTFSLSLSSSLPLSLSPL